MIVRSALTLLLACSASSFTIAAIGGVFDDPENLTHLPESISPGQLRAVMKSFSKATGLRCSGCHVGEEGQSLTEYDFPSDENRYKRITREMMEMVTAVNDDHLSSLKGNKRINCMTCHRGIAEPHTTVQVLNKILNKKGIEAMITRHAELREQYYGTHSYDFSEAMLVTLAERQTERQPDHAIRILTLNLQHYPDSFQSHFMLGSLYQQQGQTDLARQSLLRADAIQPHPQVKQALKALESE